MLFLCYLAAIYKIFGAGSTSHLFYVLFYGVPLLICILVTVAQKDPLEFLLKVSIFLLPFLGIFIPPRRYNLSFLNALSVLVGIYVLVYRISGREAIRLFPRSAALVPLLFVLPSVATSMVFVNSLGTVFVFSGYYMLFIAFNHYLQKEGWTDRVLFGLAVSLLLASLMIYLHHLTGFDPSFTRHSREYGHFGGLLVHRSSGVFQDPQKAAQYFGVFLVFYLIVAIRKCATNRLYHRLFILAAVSAVPALLCTVSRASIFAAALVAITALPVLNRYRIPVKILLWVLVLTAGITAAMMSTALFTSLMPASLAARAAEFQQGAQGRMDIWKSTWYMFENNPVTGLGPGGYRRYLILTDSDARQRVIEGRPVPIMPESGYLKILYETGISGMLGCAYFLLYFFVLVLRRLTGPVPAAGKSIVWASAAGMTVFLGAFATNYTLHDARAAMIPILLLVLVIQAERVVAIGLRGPSGKASSEALPVSGRVG